MYLKAISLGSILVLAFTCPRGAFAQTTQGNLQVGIGTDFVNHSSSMGKWELPAETEESEAKQTHWGFSRRNYVLIEGGYGIGDSIVVGGLLGIGGGSDPRSANTLRLDENEESSFELFIAPKIDYLFLPTSRIRPFLGGAVGLSYYSETLEHTNN